MMRYYAVKERHVETCNVLRWQWAEIRPFIEWQGDDMLDVWKRVQDGRSDFAIYDRDEERLYTAAQMRVLSTVEA